MTFSTKLLFVICSASYFTSISSKSLKPDWEDGLSEEEKKLILDIHNEYRSSCAKGKYQNKKGTELGDYLPSASNMRALIWDNDIAEAAQKYAEKRVFEHSKTDNGDRFEGAGENLAYRRQKGYEFDRKGVLSKLVHNLGDEITECGIDSLTFAGSKNNCKIGHTTQMLWDKTERVGCGSAHMKPGEMLLVCQYYPDGNYIDEEIYTTGDTASGCEKPYVANKNEGLCEKA